MRQAGSYLYDSPKLAEESTRDRVRAKKISPTLSRGNSMKDVVVVRALRSMQGDRVPVYSFFIPGGDLLRVASISRIERSPTGSLDGFQREGIRRHVAAIAEFLD